MTKSTINNFKSTRKKVHVQYLCSLTSVCLAYVHAENWILKRENENRRKDSVLSVQLRSIMLYSFDVLNFSVDILQK
jgi:hypothetical protein